MVNISARTFRLIFKLMIIVSCFAAVIAHSLFDQRNNIWHYIRQIQSGSSSTSKSAFPTPPIPLRLLSLLLISTVLCHSSMILHFCLLLLHLFPGCSMEYIFCLFQYALVHTSIPARFFVFCFIIISSSSSSSCVLFFFFLFF